MRSGSSELLLEQQQQELRRYKLKELAPKKKNVAPKRTFKQHVKFYCTSILAFFSVMSGGVLLFLVPLYVDPAISTIVADFIDHPTMCITTRKVDMTGLFNCSWSSCREGCTSDMYKCTHIYVQYIEQTNQTLYSNLTSMMLSNNLTDFEHSEEAILLVNIKGCGYPPNVTCKNFTELYGYEGAIFPCYYSKQNKTVVMTSYQRDDQITLIINCFLVPFVITVISSIGLCLLHCECTCKKERTRRRRTQLQQQQRRRPRIENLR